MSPASVALPTFSDPVSGKPLPRYAGGTTKQVGTYNFPVSQGLAGASMTLEPDALRETHWHALRNTSDGPTDVLVVFNLQIPVPLADQLPRANREFAPAR
jgi:hypothetical protein